MNSAAAEALADGVQLLRLVDKCSSTLMSPPPSEDKAPPSSQKSTSNHSDHEPKPSSGDDKTAYIESLKEEREHLTQYADGFNHVFTLIDKEIKRVSSDEKDVSKESTGGTLTETIVVPVEQYPNYNFVGRILGPRGTTAKQLEATTGCRVTILGRVKKDGASAADSTAQGDIGPLRVQISCPADVPEAAQRMETGVNLIKALLVPPADGQDELKRQQLMVLANMNGTYRPRSTAAQTQFPSASGEYGNQFQNLLPYGYRLPLLSKSQHEMAVRSLMGNDTNNSHSQKSECFNPKCAILRSLIEQNVPLSKNAIPRIDDVLGVMHMYELMNRIRLANSSLFGDHHNREEMVKAQEIGNRMCSSFNSVGPRSERSSSSAANNLTSPARHSYKSRPQSKK